MNTSLPLALRQGRLLEAARQLSGLATVSQEHAVASVELSWLTGKSSLATTEAKHLLRAVLSPGLRCRLLLVVAGVRFDEGFLEEAVALTREAHQVALMSDDHAAISRS